MLKFEEIIEPINNMGKYNGARMSKCANLDGYQISVSLYYVPGRKSRTCAIAVRPDGTRKIVGYTVPKLKSFDGKYYLDFSAILPESCLIPDDANRIIDEIQVFKRIVAELNKIPDLTDFSKLIHEYNEKYISEQS